MSDLEKKEKENFLRHAILVVDHCKDALISLIERDITLKGVTFEQFLNNNQHDIFHMCKEKICNCGTRQRFLQVFFKSQIELLFDIGLGAAKPGASSEVLDMTLARCLLVNFCFDVFWDYNLQYKGQPLEAFLNAEIHTIYHLWQNKSNCCHCPSTFNSSPQKLNKTEWESMFHVVLPQLPCSMQAKTNVAACYSLCIHEAKQISTLNLTQKLQQEILKHCCILRKTTEKLVDIRNFEYGHVNNARMSDSDFEESKKTIIESIHLIAKLCGKDTEMKKTIDATLRDSLDHKLVEKYKKLMSEIYKNFQQQNEKIQKIESNIVQTNTRIDVVSSSVDHISNRVDDTNSELDRTNTRVDVVSNRVDDTNTELDRTNTRVDVISNRVDDTNTELGRTNRKVDVISNRVDNTDAGLETLQTKINETDQRLGIVSKQVDDPLPPNIREQNTNDLKKWKKEDEDFVPTRSSKRIYDCVASNSCVTITGPAGCGKTFLARHTALVLEKDGYDIIIIKTPKDIRDFYKPGRKTVFIVDDICGNFTASQEKIDNWLQFQDTVDRIVKDKNCKIVVSCRLQVYRDNNFKCLSNFLSCECNLISESLCLSLEEKAAMIKQYTGEKIDTLVIRQKLGTAGAFLPLLCSLYRKQNETSALNFLQNPFGKITKELDCLFDRKDDSGKYKICSLILCVLFNNSLDADWFKGKVTKEQRSLLDDLSDVCKLDRRLSKQSIEDELNTLVGTFVIKVTEVKCSNDLSDAFKVGRLPKTKYKAIYDKVFDFYSWYFGKKITSCIIDHGDSDLIHERFRWNLEEIDKSGDMEYLVDIPDEYLDLYIERMVTDWSNGKVIKVFNNINMRQHVFRQHFLRYLSSQTQYNINHLIEKKDATYNGYDTKYGFMYQVSSADKNLKHGLTALSQSILNIFLDIFKWLLSYNANESFINQTDCFKQSLLNFALMKGNLDIIFTLLRKNPDINLCNDYGRSPLWIACYIGNVEIVSKLLEKDPDVNLCDEDGRSSLWIACARDNVEIVSELLEKDPEVNLCDEGGKSPLWVACSQGKVKISDDLWGRFPLWLACATDNVEIVSKLLEKDPDVNLCEDLYKKSSPLWKACENGNVEIVSKLLEKDPDVNLCEDLYKKSSPLWKACENGNVEIVSKLLEKDPDVNLCDDEESKSPLWIACENGNVEIVSKLLEKDPDVNLCDKYGRSPLWIACLEGNVEIVSKLLEKDPDVNLCDEDGRSPLWIACARDDEEIVSEFLEKNPDVNICDEYGLACLKGNVEIVSELLEKDPDVNLCDEESKSPLWIACENGNVEIVSKLLEKDPDINLCDDDGQSPLVVACYDGNVEIVSKLLEKNPDMYVHDEDDDEDDLDPLYIACERYPLYIACANGNVEILSKLLEKDPEINVHDQYGQSPLGIACYNGNVEIVSKLLEKNPDVNILEEYGMSPLSIAKDQGNEEIIELLENYKDANPFV